MLEKICSATVAVLLIGASVAHAESEDGILGTRHDIKHVLLISVDGLHALDLANFVSTHPDSTLAALSRHGVTYTNSVVKAAVSNQQVAPTIIRALGLNTEDLDAVRKEQIQPHPFLFSGRNDNSVSRF